MTRLLIPTRNRPTSLLSVVTFLERFYPGTRLIVADGSAEEFAEANRAAMTAPGREVEIEYRRYPYDLDFFDRILDVLETIDDTNIIMGSDDDYPLMDVLAKAEATLDANPAASSVMGAMLCMRLAGPDELNGVCSPARAISGDSVVGRMREFARWSFPTTYTVTRREHLIERYRRSREVFLLGFFDFCVGLKDCAHGEIIALPDFGYVSTANYNHSYLRPDSKMLYVRRPDEIARIKAFIVEDLVEYGGLDPAAAEAEAWSLLRTRASEHTGALREHRVGFERDPLFAEPAVAAQLALYREVFRPGTTAHARFADRLGAIRDALVATARSADNKGEPLRLRSLQEQRDAATDAREVPDPDGNAPHKPPHKTLRHDLYHPARLIEGLDIRTAALKVDPKRELVVLALGGPLLAGPDAALRLDRSAGVPVSTATPGLWGALAARVTQRLTAQLSVASLTHDGPMEDWGRGETQLAAVEAALPALAAADHPPRFIIWQLGGWTAHRPLAADRAIRAFAELHRIVTPQMPEATWLICRGAGHDAPPQVRERVAFIHREILRRCGNNVLPGPDLDHLSGDPADPAMAGAVAGLLHDAMRTVLRPAPTVAA